MKKVFSGILSALILTGTSSAALASDISPTALNDQESINLVGEGTPFKGPMEMQSGSLEDLFDGDMSTYVDYGVDGGAAYHIGIQFDRPTVLTLVQLAPPDYDNNGVPDRVHCLYGTVIEGSNDGENWDFILELGDDYAEYEEFAWDFEDGISNYFDEVPFDGESDIDDDATEPTAYTSYRIWNTSKGIAVWGDIELYGYFIEGETAAPETATPETDAPETDAPETDAPETDAPETAAPETATPETAAPETATPETAAPETAASETVAPETAASETDAPETDAPVTDSSLPISADLLAALAITAVAVIASVIGFAIAKKKK